MIKRFYFLHRDALNILKDFSIYINGKIPKEKESSILKHKKYCLTRTEKYKLFLILIFFLFIIL